MDSVNFTALFIGITCAGVFVAWLLGRQSESLAGAFDSLPTALVVFGALCAAPFFFYGTWQQYGAKTRLQQENLPVCASLGHAVGAQGGRAPRGIWRFEALDEPERILDFYATVCPKTGWQVVKKKNGLLLSKPGLSFALWTEKQGAEEQIIFQKSP